MKEKIRLFERKRRNDLSQKCGVYAIFVANHVYVGSSENLSRRLTEHRMDIPKENRGCKILHNLYKIYPKDSFYYCVLEYCTPEKRLALERHYIDYLKADCNTATNPQNPITHCIKVYQYDTDGNYIHEYDSVTDAARRVHGQEGNISIAIKHHRYAYNSLWSFDKKKHYPFSASTKLKTKKVYMYIRKNHTFIREFVSISEAARFLMFSFPEYKNFDSLCASISGCCAMKYKNNNYNGYSFQYQKTTYIPKQQNK